MHDDFRWADTEQVAVSQVGCCGDRLAIQPNRKPNNELPDPNALRSPDNLRDHGREILARQTQVTTRDAPQEKLFGCDFVPRGARRSVT